MKKLFITLIFVFIIIYPPASSKGEEKRTVKESVLNYLRIKNEVLKYQIQKGLNEVNQTIKNQN